MTSHNRKSRKAPRNQAVPVTKKSPDERRVSNVAQPDDKFKILFNNYLVHFLGKIKKDCDDSEILSGLDHCYAKFRKYADQGKLLEYVEHTYNRFQPHMELISQEDEFLFSLEYARDHDLRLVSALDIIKIYATIDQEEDEKKKKRMKKAVWSALRNIYISCCYILGLKGDRWMTTILENLKLQQELDKEIEAEPEEPEENDLGGINLPNIADIEKIFNKDNPISQLIKDVKDEFNPQDFIKTLNPENKPPIEIITGLFSGQNNDTLMNMASTFTNKFKEKMEKRGYTENDLKNAAEDIRTDLVNMPGMGMINKLLEGVVQSMPEDMLKGVTAAPPMSMDMTVAVSGDAVTTEAEVASVSSVPADPQMIDPNPAVTMENLMGNMFSNLMGNDPHLQSQFQTMKAEWDNLMSTMANTSVAATSGNPGTVMNAESVDPEVD